MSFTGRNLWKWVGTPERAVSHRVAPYLHRLNLPEVGEGAARFFRREFLKTSVQNEFFFRKTVRLLRLFRENGMEAMPLKGALFACRFYPDLGTRPQSDVDLLIREGDLSRGHDLLLCDGWREAYPRGFYKGHYHWAYRHEDDRCLLELHWAFKFPGTCAPDLDRVWKHASFAERAGVRFLEMAPEDLLEYMAVNKAMQRYSMLLDFLDLAQIISSAAIDWDLFMRNVISDGTAGPVWYGLIHCREYLGTPVPQGILDRLSNSWSAWGARGLKRMLARWGGPAGTPLGFLDGPAGRLAEAALEGRPLAIANLIRPLIFPSEGRVRVLSGGSYAAYYRNNFKSLTGQILALSKSRSQPAAR